MIAPVDVSSVRLETERLILRPLCCESPVQTGHRENGISVPEGL